MNTKIKEAIDDLEFLVNTCFKEDDVCITKDDIASIKLVLQECTKLYEQRAAALELADVWMDRQLDMRSVYAASSMRYCVRELRDILTGEAMNTKAMEDEYLLETYHGNTEVCPSCGTGCGGVAYWAYCPCCENFIKEGEYVSGPKEHTMCTWQEDDDGNWETECGNMHIINEGTPEENDMQFCTYCGGRLISKAYAQETP